MRLSRIFIYVSIFLFSFTLSKGTECPNLSGIDFGQKSTQTLEIHGQIRGDFFPPYRGGNAKIDDISPPLLRGQGGKSGFISPPLLRGQGGNFRYFPPYRGGNTGICPPQAGNFEDFRSVFARKTRPKCLRNVFLVSKMPKNFPPAAGILLQKSTQ